MPIIKLTIIIEQHKQLVYPRNKNILKQPQIHDNNNLIDLNFQLNVDLTKQMFANIKYEPIKFIVSNVYTINFNGLQQFYPQVFFVKCVVKLKVNRFFLDSVQKKKKKKTNYYNKFSNNCQHNSISLDQINLLFGKYSKNKCVLM